MNPERDLDGQEQSEQRRRNSEACHDSNHDFSDPLHRMFEYMEQLDEDLNWSILSNSFFLVGGIAYVALTLWDLLLPVEDQPNRTWFTDLYVCLDVMAPAVYLFNSFVDILWAQSAQQKSKLKKSIVTATANLLDETALDSAAPEDNDDQSLWSELGESLQCVRKYAAHRRSKIAAFTFGIAATFACLEVIFRYTLRRYLWLIFVADACANQMYVVSSLFTITGKRKREFSLLSCDFNNVDDLEDVGDLLFFLGSVMDSVLTDTRFDSPILPVISSFLWLLDACLYARADDILLTETEHAPQHGNLV